jgi:hypothetical protein
MRYQNSIALILFIVLIMSFPVTGLCQGEVTFKPKVSTTWRVDDNFYKAEAIEREVTTSILQPGFEFSYSTPKSVISLDYTLNAYYYDDEDPLLPGMRPAQDEDYVGHTGILEVKNQPTSRLTMGLSDSYYYTRDPAQSDVFSNSVSREKYYINRLTPFMFYDLGARLSAGFRYRHTKTDYSEEVSEGSTENRGIFDLVYNFDSTTSLDLEYQYWNRDYDKVSSDYESGQIRLILRKQYKYFSFEAGGGYHERNFDDPYLENIDVITYRVGLTGQTLPSARGDIRSYITLVAESNFNDAGPGDSYFEGTRFSMDAGHLFGNRIPVDMTASFQNSDYERQKGLTPAGTLELRDDDTYKLEGSLGYIVYDDSVRYLVVKVAGGYEDRSSNMAGRDYTNNYVMAKVDLKFSLGKR